MSGPQWEDCKVCGGDHWTKDHQTVVADRDGGSGGQDGRSPRMSGNYATGSTVPVNKSIDEIRRLLLGAGASHYAFGEDPDKAAVQFGLDGLHYRFTVQRPTWEIVKARFRDPRRVASPAAAVDAEWRRRWRARVLWVKAQIEFAADEPEVFKDAMLAFLVLPDGQTLGAWSEPQVEAMYRDGSMPPLLTSGESR